MPWRERWCREGEQRIRLDRHQTKRQKKMNSQHNQLPEFEILEVFRGMRRATLPYLERKLREAIRLSKADPRLSDREFLKTNLESMQRERLIGEIEAHSDSLRAYYLTSVGFERYCALKATREEVVAIR